MIYRLDDGRYLSDVVYELMRGKPAKRQYRMLNMYWMLVSALDGGSYGYYCGNKGVI